MSDFRDKYWFKDIRDITTIKDLLYGSVETYPERPAFWVKKKKGAPYEPVSYTLLKHDVQALGTQIRAMALAGERIGVMGQGCYEWIATYLAVVIGGGVIVPIDKELDSEAIQNVISTAECRTVFYTSDEASKFESVSGVENHVIMQFYGDRTDMSLSMVEYLSAMKADAAVGAPGARQDVESICAGANANYYDWKELTGAGESLMALGNSQFASEDVDPDRMSVLLFTSGTTGNPKGVMLSQRNITANIMGYVPYSSHTSDGQNSVYTADTPHLRVHVRYAPRSLSRSEHCVLRGTEVYNKKYGRGAQYCIYRCSARS